MPDQSRLTFLSDFIKRLVDLNTNYIESSLNRILFYQKENENSVVRKCAVNQPMLLLGKNVEKSEL